MISMPHILYLLNFKMCKLVVNLAFLGCENYEIISKFKNAEFSEKNIKLKLKWVV